MDTDIDLFIETAGAPPPGAFIGVRLLFEQQEERFSRFREQSLLSRLNRGEVIEDAWLARVVAMAIDAHQLTGGYCNPLVLPDVQGDRCGGPTRAATRARSGEGHPGLGAFRGTAGRADRSRRDREGMDC